MKTENKIIKKLIEKKKAFTIREIAKRIKADYKITYIAAKRLISRDILRKEDVGGSSLCSLNPKYYGKEIYDAEYERAQELLKDKNIKILVREVIGRIKYSFFILIIFGSYARKRQDKGSDIDLMFISNEKRLEEDVSRILDTLPIKTHTFVFDENQFENMLNSRETNVVKEAVQDCIIIYGIENYYKLLKC